jgi:oligopeptide/dipeptide ABC transporter ATP-binding protein
MNHPRNDTQSLVTAVDVTKIYDQRRFSRLRRAEHSVRALESVSLSIHKGETVGLVGESGCGKTTLGKAILRLIGEIAGDVHFAGESIYGLDGSSLRELRKRMQMIFQNPYAALNNHMRVEEIIAEGVSVSGRRNGVVVDRVAELLDCVNLNPDKAAQYPWELSGGERRRVGIARILAVDPEFIVADEPVAALDLSIKSQVINLLTDLREQRRLTYLFISHDIDVVRYVSDRVAVMYLGAIVEVGNTDEVSEARCLHPYTRQLLAAADYMSSGRAQSGAGRIEGGLNWEVPTEMPSGCRYHPRCALYQKLGRPPSCRMEIPTLSLYEPDGETSHSAACHFAGEKV